MRYQFNTFNAGVPERGPCSASIRIEKRRVNQHENPQVYCRSAPSTCIDFDCRAGWPRGPPSLDGNSANSSGTPARTATIADASAANAIRRVLRRGQACLLGTLDFA
jgi:hypothetical protein